MAEQKVQQVVEAGAEAAAKTAQVAQAAAQQAAEHAKALTSKWMSNLVQRVETLVPAEQREALQERAREVYSQQAEFVQEQVGVLKESLKDREEVIKNLVMRFDTGALPSLTKEMSPDDKDELLLKSEALVQKTMLENFELREENERIKKELEHLKEKAAEQELALSMLEKAIAVQPMDAEAAAFDPEQVRDMQVEQWKERQNVDGLPKDYPLPKEEGFDPEALHQMKMYERNWWKRTFPHKRYSVAMGLEELRKAPEILVTPPVEEAALKIKVVAPFHGEQKDGEFDIVDLQLEINPEESGSVGELKAKLREEFNLAKETGIRLFNGPVEVASDEDALSFFGVISDACVLVLLLSESSEEPTEEVKRDDDLADLGSLAMGFMTRQKTMLDPVLFEKAKGCYILPCNHGITAQSLFDLAMSQYQKKETCVTCPHIVEEDGNKPCKARIEHVNVRQILEHAKIPNILHLDVVAAETMMKERYGVQRCNCCNALLYRKKDSREVNANCSFCNKNICWMCGNELTEGFCKCLGWARGEILHTLATCPTKTIYEVSGVPTVRACPECSQLITHLEACKHIQCRCQTNFCFVCLKKYLPKEGRWQCGSSGDVCPVHPRQTEEHLQIQSQGALFKFKAKEPLTEAPMPTPLSPVQEEVTEQKGDA